MPRFATANMAWVRLDTLRRLKILERWILTVPSDKPSRLAISRFDFPLTIKPSTSICRSVNSKYSESSFAFLGDKPDDALKPLPVGKPEGSPFSRNASRRTVSRRSLDDALETNPAAPELQFHREIIQR